MNFSVIKRNPGHWDICAKDSRFFRIRGTPGRFLVIDERAIPSMVIPLPSVELCFSFIIHELTQENLKADPSSPGNNIPL